MDEKALPRARTRFNAVGFFLSGLRIWQWSSSFFVYGSFSLLYDHVQKNKLGENDRMKAVEILGLISLVHTTLAIGLVQVCKTLGLRCWRTFAMTAMAGDLIMIGLCIAKITILSYSGLPADCHGLTRDNYTDSDLVRQPANGYSTIRFGSGSMAVTGELDRWCTFPRTVYGLSCLAIFSYTFTLLLTVLYLQQERRDGMESEKFAPQPNSPRPTLRYVGLHIASSTHTPPTLDLDLESNPSSPRASSQTFNSSASSPHQTPSTRTSRTPSITSSWGGITLGTCSSSNSGDTDSILSGGSQPLAPLPGAAAAAPPRRRWSTSTSSSYNANAFIVTDGFHPGEEERPPAYESRPGSLYNETVKYPAALGLPGTPKP